MLAATAYKNLSRGRRQIPWKIRVPLSGDAIARWYRYSSVRISSLGTVNLIEEHRTMPRVALSLLSHGDGLEVVRADTASDIILAVYSTALYRSLTHCAAVAPKAAHPTTWIDVQFHGPWWVSSLSCPSGLRSRQLPTRPCQLRQHCNSEVRSRPHCTLPRQCHRTLFHRRPCHLRCALDHLMTVVNQYNRDHPNTVAVRCPDLPLYVCGFQSEKMTVFLRSVQMPCSQILSAMLSPGTSLICLV